MTTLAETAEKNVETRKEWLEEAEIAQRALLEIPELANLETDYCDVDYSKSGEYLNIRISYAGDESDENTRITQKLLESIGIQLDEPQYRFSDNFESTGNGKCNGVNVEITLSGYGIPLGCEIVYKRRMRKVAELICQKTGKIVS